MKNSTERLFSKAATCRRMKISRARYEQLIEAGMLSKPIAIVEGSRPVHTESQIQLATSAIYQQSCAGYIERQRLAAQKGYKPMKPISDKIIQGIRLYREGKGK